SPFVDARTALADPAATDPAVRGFTHPATVQGAHGGAGYPGAASGVPGASKDDGLLPWIRRGPLAPVGSGDGGVMAYGFRVCLSRAPDRMPFPRRDGYDPAEWELGRRYLRALTDAGRTPRAEELLGLVPDLPNGKCDGDSVGPFSLDLLDGSNWAYPEATPAERERIRQRHLDYTQDFLYFL